MLASISSYQDAIARPGDAEISALFPTLSKEFLFRQPSSKTFPRVTNNAMPASLQGQQPVTHEDVLVRLPSVRDSKWKVRVLQGWVGIVNDVKGDRFSAVLADTTNSRNAPEQVELDLEEVSESDRPLLTEGATFYWSIGYRDTPGGQRERISSLRFARQPRLSENEVNRIFDRADNLAALLESD
jgi:hypothetical protein